MQIYLNLPFPPTVNSYYSITNRGKFISKRGTQFRKDAMQACREQKVNNLALDDRFNVEVILYPPDKRVRDLDNYMKALLDAITHADLWVDDNQIDLLHIYRGIVIPDGLTRMRITSAQPFILPNKESIWDYIDSD